METALPLMLSICTPDALVVSTTDNHLTWLGRDRESVIGHRCSEWANPDHWDLNWHLFQRSLSTGMPMTWERSVQRPDGTYAAGQITVKPIRSRKGRLMLCVNRVMPHLEATSLNADMARCLAQMSGILPRDTLRQSLEELAADAAGVAESWCGALH
jgi:PAS domain S-box-containing protein